MDQAHFHLMLTHFPIVGTILGLIVLAGGILLSNITVKRTALAIFVCSAIVAIPSFLTGEGAEEVVEKIPGIMKSTIHEHEEIAEVYIWIIGALGVTAAFTLIFDILLKNPGRILYFAVFILAVTATAFSYRVGNFGGQVSHAELRSNAGAAATQNFENSEDDD